MDMKVFDADRFNKQKSYQDLLLENAELRAEITDLKKQLLAYERTFNALNSDTRFSDGEEGEENP